MSYLIQQMMKPFENYSLNVATLTLKFIPTYPYEISYEEVEGIFKSKINKDKD